MPMSWNIPLKRDAGGFIEMTLQEMAGSQSLVGEPAVSWNWVGINEQ